MTAYSITVSNSLRAFGGGPPSLWNAYNWNAYKWGEGTATIPHQVVHLVTNTLTPDSARFFNFTHLVENTLSPDTTINYRVVFLIQNTLAFTAEPSAEYLQDGEGYTYVFPDRTTNADSRSTASWTSSTGGSAAWTSMAVTTTTWSTSA